MSDKLQFVAARQKLNKLAIKFAAGERQAEANRTMKPAFAILAGN